MDFAVNQMSIDAPLIDFLSSDVAGLMLENASEVQYLGTSLIRDEVFHHIALRSEETDVQIWIATEGQHLPGKIAISSKWEGGAPRFVAFLDWDTEPDFPQGSLVFVPPEGAAEVEMLLDSQQ